MSVEEIIAGAGRRSLTVQIRVEKPGGLVEEYEVEPYSHMQKGTDRLLFCLDVNSYEYKNIDLALIRTAEMTRRFFKPRFPVAL